ncbi:MAG: 9-O-acetylesterase [Prevotella sp.]|nr:9-O-acetylesterase [Prevotella sp.]MBR7053498.1 9-O-acetylesterase [Prevotella sp.]
MKKRTILLAVAALLTVCSQAKVRLPHLIGDNMVLQQNTEARLWGWAAPGKTVSVTVSWNAKTYTARASKDGRWLVKVDTPKASYTPLSVTFDDGEPLTIHGVLSGEVWVCAGQSNMEMPVRGFGNCPVEGYNDAVLEARDYAAIHYVKVPSVMSMTPLDDANCEWRVTGPSTVGEASATGYFFAQVLTKALDVPVGLVIANKGGTRVESWLTRENLAKHTKEPLDTMGIVNGHSWDYHRQLVWGNGTFNPILNYTVKGIIYYQGCSNVGDPGNQYSERLQLLVEQWRGQFGLGEIPFYFVEIAPYHYDDVNGEAGARLREQQYLASKKIPNCGLVCTNDLAYPYETTQIHPAQKRPVGRRLAFLALNQTYGMSDVWCKSPSFKDMKIDGSVVHIHLADDYGSISRFTDIEGFELAGDDHVFHPAKAEHFWQPGGGEWDETIKLSSPEVTHPVAVRYCFRNFKLGNLKNGAGLPLFPFRTDNW